MRFIQLLALMLLLTVTGYSATLNVPGTYVTIQDAIDAAADGDVVLVEAGTYLGCIDYLGKKITLRSVSGPELTVIDGESLDTVVSFINGEDKDAVLEGFTVTNGDNNGGGGVNCLNSSPTIQGNIIRNNLAGHGGGIYCSGSAPSILNNVISDNEAEDGGGISCRFSATPLISGNKIQNNHATTQGGGIECFDHAAPTITDNIIEGNYTSLTFSWGAGIFCKDYSNAQIVGNVIRNNTAVHSGGGVYDAKSSPLIAKNIIMDNEAQFNFGGGIATSDNSDAVIRENIVAHNIAGMDGGGVYTWYTGTTTITGCTIVANTAGGKAGGLYVGAWCDVDVNNTILWNDTGVTGNEIYVGEMSSPGTCTIDFSNVEDTGANSVIVYHANMNWGGNVYSVDPLFVDEAGRDFHLGQGSQLIDLGNNVAPSVAPDDFEMDPRIVNGTVDIGADEYSMHLYCHGDARPGQTFNLRLIGDPGKQTMMFFSAGALSSPINTNFGYWHLQLPVLTIPLGVIPANGMIDVPILVPIDFDAPATIYLQVIVLDTITNLFKLSIEE